MGFNIYIYNLNNDSHISLLKLRGIIKILRVEGDNFKQPKPLYQIIKEYLYKFLYIQD